MADKRHDFIGVQHRERTYTDNISPHGVRVHSTRPWKPGEQVVITPLTDGPVRAEVVYCEKRGEGQFFVGIQVRQMRIRWTRLGTPIMALSEINAKRPMQT